MEEWGNKELLVIPLEESHRRDRNKLVYKVWINMKTYSLNENIPQFNYIFIVLYVYDL